MSGPTGLVGPLPQVVVFDGAGLGLLAVVCAGLAAALLVPGPVSGRAPLRPTAGIRGRGVLRSPARLVILLGALGLAGVVVGAAPLRPVVLAVVATMVAAGAVALVRARRERRRVEAARGHVLEVCRVLAAELAAGRPPGAALERAAVEWPVLGPAAAVQRLGGDVPGVLRRLALDPGHGELALVAAAWQVAHGSGGGLAVSLRRLAGSIRAGQATGRIVSAELASARATARLMAGLPVLALLMGGGIGGDPLGFLTGTVPGLACLAGGLLLGLSGLWWIEAIARGVADET